MIVRNCVRALIEDDAGRILLMQISEPGTGRSFWVTPGGGKEPGEDDLEALCRELHEETGLGNVEVGPLIWTRDFTFAWTGETYRQLERFYWIRCPAFDAEPVALTGDVESSSFAGLRWWSLGEVRSSTETFAPLDLADQVERLHREGPPHHPVTLGA